MLEFDTMRYSTKLKWLAPPSSTAVIRVHSNDFDDAVLYTMCDVKELKSMVNVFSVAQNLIAETFQRWHKQ